jgi:4-carboxymuconolactone decarboxylase
MTDDGYDREGLAMRRRALGGEYVDRALENATDFTREFQQFITRYAWGEVWTRPGLEPRTRSLVTIALLAALGREEELKLHIRATANTGATPEEIKEALFHVAVYAGVPAANTAFRVANQTLREMGKIK